MPTVPFVYYDSFLDNLHNGKIIWEIDTFHLTLHNFPNLDLDFTQWSDVSGSDLTPSGAYVAGGLALSGVEFSDLIFKIGDLEINPLSGTFSQGIVRKIGTVAGGLIDPLCMRIPFNSNNSISITNGRFVFGWEDSGPIRVING